MKKYTNLFLIIITSASLVNCKKKKIDVLPSVSHQLSIDNTFGNNGRLVFSAKDYFKINLLQNYIILSDDPSQSFHGIFSLSKIDYNGASDINYGLGGRLDISVNKEVGDASVLNDGSCWLTYNVGAIHYNNLGYPDDSIPNMVYHIVQYDENRLLCFAYDTIYRYYINGTPDLSFGANGFIHGDISYGAMEYLGDFFTCEGGGIQFLIKKVKANGALDNTFASNGTLDASIYKGDGYSFKIYNDRIYVFCSVQNDDYTFSINIKCYSLNGSLDNSFGNSGLLILTYPQAGSSLFTRSVDFQNDNIYILSGCYKTNVNTKGVLSRVKTNGQEFKSFGDNGFMLLGDNIGMGIDMKIKNDNLFALAKYDDGTNTSFTNSTILLKYLIK
ncbi:MAG TPA: hypothetical protein VNB90_15165 [Cytophagaceae bacterium]|jgi:hypothetical protein|nr:hypothetical protein [Cytophagaceae bacterium]